MQDTHRRAQATKLFNRLVKKHFGDPDTDDHPLPEKGLRKAMQQDRIKYNGSTRVMSADNRAPTPLERLHYYYRGLEEQGTRPGLIPNTKLFNRYKGFKAAAVIQLLFEGLGYEVKGTRGREGYTMTVGKTRITVLSRYKATRPGRSSLAPSYLFQFDNKALASSDLFLCWVEPLRLLYVFPREALDKQRICINKSVAYPTKAQFWYKQFENRFDLLLRVLDGKPVTAELKRATSESLRAYNEAYSH